MSPPTDDLSWGGRSQVPEQAHDRSNAFCEDAPRVLYTPHSPPRLLQAIMNDTSETDDVCDEKWK